jgi:hypothetical protein
MIVTSTGIVSRKYRRGDADGSQGAGKAWSLLVRFTDPRTRRQKTQSIACTESEYNRFTVGDIIGLQRDTAWWALWASWHLAV